MDVKLIFSKIIVLLYRSRLIESDAGDNVAKTILDTIDPRQQKIMVFGKNLVARMKDMCMMILNDKDVISKEVFLPELRQMLEHDDALYESIKDQIEPDYSDSSNKRIITAHIKSLNNYYREKLASDIISSMYDDVYRNRGSIENFSNYLQTKIAELEPYTTTMDSRKDPALVNEVDFASPETLEEVLNEVRNMNNNNSIYRFGWQGLNRMTQGGLRRGECVGVEALQHKYKTGFTMSMFCDIPMYNKPIMTEEEIAQNKKPLMLRISFEDSLTNNTQFMYQYLKASDGVKVMPKDFDKLPVREMREYVVEKLTSNGFHIKMMRVDPSQWTINSVFSKILELEADGYAIHVLMLDYLFMLPTTGCIQGPMGTDKRDMLRRIRNFCSARNIAFITPFQLSTEAKNLLRNGVANHHFVKEISEKGYTADSKQVDQELDLELYVHLFQHGKRKILSVGRGKHRLPTVIPEEDKYFMMTFPDLNIPILPDIDKEDTSFQRLTSSGASSDMEDVLNSF